MAALPRRPASRPVGTATPRRAAHRASPSWRVIAPPHPRHQPRPHEERIQARRTRLTNLSFTAAGEGAGWGGPPRSGNRRAQGKQRPLPGSGSTCPAEHGR